MGNLINLIVLRLASPILKMDPEKNLKVKIEFAKNYTRQLRTDLEELYPLNKPENDKNWEYFNDALEKLYAIIIASPGIYEAYSNVNLFLENEELN